MSGAAGALACSSPGASQKLFDLHPANAFDLAITESDLAWMRSFSIGEEKLEADAVVSPADDFRLDSA